METERLRIFDDDRNPIGVATREEVHKLGYWHEVFHCWVVSHEAGKDYVYLQLRSDSKRDYPGLLDITAAGHLLENERIQDGVREVKEEIGLDVAFEELIPLGIIDYHVVNGNLIDKEIANVFLYKMRNTLDDFVLQEEEVAGVVKVAFTDFIDFWLDKRKTIKISGYKLDGVGGSILVDEYVGRNRFVPHQSQFYQEINQRMKQVIEDR